MKYKSEEQFVNELEINLNKLNYKTWREVIPCECDKWNKPYRVDLIVWHPTFGFIGIEAKNTHSLRQGAILAQAVRQIEIYKKLHFFNGIKINRWCIAIPQKVEDIIYEGDKNGLLREVNSFIQGFLKNMYNISIISGLSINPYTTDKIDFKYNNINELPPIYDNQKRCSQCDADLDIEDRICPYCNKLNEDDNGDS